MLITKDEEQRQNKKMKSLAQPQKYMLKKGQVMQDMPVEKHQYLWAVVLLMGLKGKIIIKLEN